MAMAAMPDHRLRAWAWTGSPDDRAGAATTNGGPLASYAVGIKDVIDVAGMPTRSGSLLTSRTPAPADAPVVARVRAAGAAVVGKTQCTEWALNDPAPTCNPWHPDRTPGGSSAGSAVAVVTGMCTATVDTQTAGDVVRPAAYNGVVGFKPTFGWAPLAGIQAVSPSVDTVGVMACEVEEAAAVAAAVAGVAPVRVPRVPSGVRVVAVRSAGARARSSGVRSSTPWRRRRWVASACPAATGRPSGCPVAPR
jgi:Asp-tRNA(Asn)/Glu-tRNA(Gln) amidotransferase A subunit family amidase